MLDQLRRDIQHRLQDLLDEADKLRHALVALGADAYGMPAAAGDHSSPTRSRQAEATARRTPRATTTGGSASPAASTPRARPRSTNAATARTASGETKRAVLATLEDGTAMTASEIAKATGLGRASVSTTLSKLAKAGEITKAARGYGPPLPPQRVSVEG